MSQVSAETPLKGLTKEQKAAAMHASGPMLVLAGPGCGKTATLVARYSWLVSKGVRPEEILAITFTRKAAREMSQRIGRVAGIKGDSCAIGTFHAVALNVMRAYPQAFGDLAERRVIGESESERLLYQVAKDNDVPVDELTEEIDRWKDKLVTPRQALESARQAEGASRFDRERRAKAYGAYQRILKEQGSLDFGDLVMALVRTMESDRKLLATLRKRYKHILVDEYQDINRGQERMIRLIAGPDANLWVVGDPDQAVYGFRGSDIRYILNFGKIYPGFTRAELTINHRSTPVITSAANHFIANNRNRFGKVLLSARDGGVPLTFHGAADPQAEAEWVASRIQEVLKGGTPPEEIAVLVRVAYHANWIEQALAARNIAFSLLGMTNFWGRAEVKQALRAISALTGTDLGEGDGRISSWLRDAVGRVDPDDFVGSAVKVCQAVGRKPPRTVTGQRREAWASAMALLADEIREQGDAEVLARKIQARAAIGEQTTGGVSIGTIHAAKGLEWSSVFLAACEQEILPHARNEDLEEERRLAFVALTRARDRFFCSWCAERSRKESGASRFVDEFRAAARGQITKA